ncbi:MAG: DUF1080 domain-containing protein [Candidatus Nealsonbacteria bacterium]|nr:DUF1080 domain-containing protein [Candidatus Nealsonbacteria bacterium]
MSRKLYLLLIPVVICVVSITLTCHAKEIYDLPGAQADPDFAVQGEYVGEGALPEMAQGKIGAQVIAQGGGKFRVVVYQGGLPGDGWKREDPRIVLEGTAEELKSDKLSGKIADGSLSIADADGKRTAKLARTDRKSPTLGAKPPAGAVVIFDGTNLDKFEPVDGHLTEDKLLLSGVTTKPEYNSYKLHLEFRLSWMPEARGQGRSNSGLYLHDCYECQVLDSFGLEGENNECGGFYQISKPIVNMCLPPMTWQTYDVDFTAPKYEDGKKTANARVVLKHNGVVIHDFEPPRGTPGRKPEGPGPRGIHLQGHGNHVLYRNVWLEPK